MSSAFGADEYWRASPAVWGPEDVHEPEEPQVSEASQVSDAEPVPANVPVFVPAASEPDEDGHAEIQLRRTDAGELALTVFTSVQMLVTCCGEDQAWVAFYAESLPDLLAATGANGIAQDVELLQLSAGES